MERICKKCGETKELSEYHRNKNTKDGHNCYCKKCVCAARRQNHKDNRERDIAKSRQYYKDNPAYSKKWNELHSRERKSRHLKRHYGIDHEQYDEMCIKQNGRCAICGKHRSKYNQDMAVDHDHITGEIRALLCINCNQGVGVFKEDITIMQNAINYLIKYNSCKLPHYK